MVASNAAWRCAYITLLIVASEAVLSGLYIDNGVDQTIIHHSMTRNERLVVEHEILELLGLSERPRRSGASSPALDRSAPSFLLDVYKQLAEEHEQARPTRSSDVALSGEEQHAIDESDLIMTFQSKKHHLGALRHGHGRHVWFEVTGAPGDASSLLTAELRLHQAPTHTENPTNLYTVVAHRVISVDNLGGLQMEQVASVNTSAGAEGWLELNVTAALGSWLTVPADNRGFFITLHPHSQPERHVKPEEIGLEEPRGAVAEGKQPFLVAFFKNGPKLGTADTGARRKREARRWRNHGYSENYLKNPLTDTAHWTTRSCEIQTLYVSFKDLEWQDWIIAPDGYGAFYCSGECNFPLNAHKNATNHAIVQTLVHLLNPTQVPKPSCAPIKLSPISVLYYTDDSNVILRSEMKPPNRFLESNPGIVKGYLRTAQARRETKKKIRGAISDPQCNELDAMPIVVIEDPSISQIATSMEASELPSTPIRGSRRRRSRAQHNQLSVERDRLLHIEERRVNAKHLNAEVLQRIVQTLNNIANAISSS